MSMKNSALMVPRGGREVQDLLYEDCINDDAGDGAEDIGHGLGVEDGARAQGGGQPEGAAK